MFEVGSSFGNALTTFPGAHEAISIVVMPPKRRAATKAPNKGRRQPEVARGNEVPADYYNDMLSEATTPMATSSGDEERPLKKRKVASRAGGALKTPTKPASSTNTTPQSLQRPAQVVYDDYRTEDSDIEFEDVGIENVPSEDDDHGVELTAADRATDLSIAVPVSYTHLTLPTKRIV